MDELTTTHTVQKSFKITEDGGHVLFTLGDDSGFIITDIILSIKNSNVILQLDDNDGNKMEILTVKAKNRIINHSFSGGLQAWSGARISLGKKTIEPTQESKVTLFINYIGLLGKGIDYGIWSQRRKG